MAGVFAVGILPEYAHRANQYLYDDETEEVPAPQWRPDVARLLRSRSIPMLPLFRQRGTVAAGSYPLVPQADSPVNHGDGFVAFLKGESSREGDVRRQFMQATAPVPHTPLLTFLNEYLVPVI